MRAGQVILAFGTEFHLRVVEDRFRRAEVALRFPRGGFSVLFTEAEDRARVIGEEFNDLEDAETQVAHLSWDVLVAIATGQCEGATPKDFARLALETELFVREPHNLYYYHVGTRELLAGQQPPAVVAPPPPKAKPKPKPKK